MQSPQLDHASYSPDGSQDVRHEPKKGAHNEASGEIEHSQALTDVVYHAEPTSVRHNHAPELNGVHYLDGPRCRARLSMDGAEYLGAQ
ncbi:hypothetical protein CHU98_g11315 [Xylaria longipes]|nr:hypothetical protein CHU98_g11315 [Xylaria longipes]